MGRKRPKPRRTRARRLTARERFYDDGTPEWMSVSEFAKLRGVTRVHAWRLVRSLHRALGDEHVTMRSGQWWARTHSVAKWFEARGKTADERITALAQKIADLEDAVRERDERIDRLAEEVRDLRDARPAGRYRP